VGHQDMASAGARAYSWGAGDGAPSGVQGQSPWSGGVIAKPPEAESLFSFGRRIVPYFAVFIRFSGDNCMTLPEIEITW